MPCSLLALRTSRPCRLLLPLVSSVVAYQRMRYQLYLFAQKIFKFHDADNMARVLLVSKTKANSDKNNAAYYYCTQKYLKNQSLGRK